MKAQQLGNASAMETCRRDPRIGSRYIVSALIALAISGTSGCSVPPEDKNGKRPSDVVREFIKLCEAEDYVAGKKLFYGPSERVTPRTFEDFCVRYRKIGLENCKIHGAVKGKADYWHVEVDFEEGGKRQHMFFYFTKVNGEWRMPRELLW